MTNRMGEGGRYEVVREIGAGAMGVVFEGFDHRMQRRVAIKQLSRALANNSKVRARFKTEALIQGGLAHQNIVRATDVLEEGGGLAIVMDYADGPSLEEYLEEQGGRLPFERTLELLEPVFDAVGTAHRHGIIHRDLKPGNIMLDRGTGREVPKVADFGIAKVIGGGEGLTREGAVMGTPAYMPPEQLRGVLDLDPRADVYALGAIVYRLVTGALPFEGGTEYEITHLVLSGERPPPPSQVVSGLPGGFDAWVERTMASERDDRYASTDDAWADLERVRGGQSVRSVPRAAPRTVPATVYEELPDRDTDGMDGFSAGRKPAVWVVAAIGVVAVVAIGVVLSTRGSSSDKPAGSSERTSESRSAPRSPSRPAPAALAPPVAPPAGATVPVSQPAVAAPDPEMQQLLADQKACQSASATNSAAAWRAYLNFYPSGKCASQAKERIAALDSAQRAAEAERARVAEAERARVAEAERARAAGAAG